MFIKGAYAAAWSTISENKDLNAFVEDIYTQLEQYSMRKWKEQLMSVKIKISYNTDEELEQIRKLLAPMFKEVKVSRNKEGRFKKAYTETK